MEKEKRIKLGSRRLIVPSYNTLGYTPLGINDFDMLHRQLFGYGLRGSVWLDSMYISGCRYWCGRGIDSLAPLLGVKRGDAWSSTITHRDRLINNRSYWLDWVRLCELCEGFISPIEGYKGQIGRAHV